MVRNSNDKLRLDRQVCFPLYATSNFLTRLYRPILSGLSLTYPQYLVMLVLWETTPLSVGELGAKLHLDSGTLTPLLKRLETAGRVTRQRDSEDERCVLIDLTPAGRLLKKEAVRVPATLEKGLNLKPEEVENLYKSVRDISGILLSRLVSD